MIAPNELTEEAFHLYKNISELLKNLRSGVIKKNTFCVWLTSVSDDMKED